MSEIDREMAKFAEALTRKGLLNQIQMTIPESLNEYERSCLDSARDNMDRYVDCMLKKIKRLGTEEARFNYKLSFAQNKLNDCFNKEIASGSKSFDRCHAEGMNRAEKFVEEFMKNIKR